MTQQEREDQEQMEYLKSWSEKKKNKKSLNDRVRAVIRRWLHGTAL